MVAQLDFPSAYREHWGRVWSYVHQRIRHRDDAEDIVQETFFKAWNANLEGTPNGIMAQLFKIASSTLIDQARSRKARANREQSAALSRPLASDQPDTAQRSEELDQLFKAIGELPPRSRQVLILHRLKCYTQREVAAQLNISLSMVEKHLLKAMRLCRQKLKRFQ